MPSYEPATPATSSPATPKKDPINLLRGWPHPSLLPTTLLASAAHTALSDPSISTPGLLYGPDPGYEPLRESLARWLSDFYHPNNENGQEKVTADRLCITGGASQNLGCVLSVYTDPTYTRCVWIVAPAYFLAFRIFEDAGLAMRAVPEDEDGVDIAFLRREIERVEQKARSEGNDRPQLKVNRPWAKVYKHVIYCVPTFANPSGKTMTLQRRRELVALAREFNALIISDDVYDFLQWPSRSSPHPLKTAALPRLVDIDRTLPQPKTSLSTDHSFGNTCSNGSLSKLAGPGLRVGWCEGTSKFAFGVSQAGTTKSGGAPSQLTSTYINILLERGELQRHISEVLCPAYARRYWEMMDAAVTELVPLGFTLGKPGEGMNEAMRDVKGGYFTWLTLPRALCVWAAAHGVDAAVAFAERCLSDENVNVAPGKLFEVPRSEMKFAGSIRLCWSWEDEGKIAEGMRRIARVAKAMIEEMEPSGIQKGYVLVNKGGGGAKRADVNDYASYY